MKPIYHNKNTVIINVQGGVVQMVQSNIEDLNVILFDVDNMEDDHTSAEIDSEWDQLTLNLPFDHNIG